MFIKKINVCPTCGIKLTPFVPADMWYCDKCMAEWCSSALIDTAFDKQLADKQAKSNPCTCGAAKCGHLKHSHWCDSLKPPPKEEPFFTLDELGGDFTIDLDTLQPGWVIKPKK